MASNCGAARAKRNEKKPCVQTNRIATAVTAGATIHNALRPGPHLPAAYGIIPNNHASPPNHTAMIGSGALLPEAISATHATTTTTDDTSGTQRRHPCLRGTS